jgi:hypothetical protein
MKQARLQPAAFTPQLVGFGPTGSRPEARTPNEAEPEPAPQGAPLRQEKTSLVEFDNAPFPYDGVTARTGQPFLNVAYGRRRGHRSPRGNVFWADETYDDPRVLLHIPAGFNAAKPAVIVLFFHGHGATLSRDVGRRQEVPQQISASGVNAVLVAPQFAFDARDSSPGKLGQPGGLKRFLDEAAKELAKLSGDPRSLHKFETMPVVIVGYSGGFLPVAMGLSKGGVASRIKGVVLLDALYGELDTFASWIGKGRFAFFLSAYANSTRRHNAELERILAARKISYKATDNPPQIRRGSVIFVPTAPDTRHRDFVTKAWVEHPLADLLRKVSADMPDLAARVN